MPPRPSADDPSTGEGVPSECRDAQGLRESSGRGATSRQSSASVTQVAGAAAILFGSCELIADDRTIPSSHCGTQRLGSPAHGGRRIAHSLRTHVHIVGGSLPRRKQLSHPCRPRHKVIGSVSRRVLAPATVDKLSNLIDVDEHHCHRLGLDCRLACVRWGADVATATDQQQPRADGKLASDFHGIIPRVLQSKTCRSTRPGQFNDLPGPFLDPTPIEYIMVRTVSSALEPYRVVKCATRHTVRLEAPDEFDLSCILRVRIAPSLNSAN